MWIMCVVTTQNVQRMDHTTAVLVTTSKAFIFMTKLGSFFVRGFIFLLKANSFRESWPVKSTSQSSTKKCRIALEIQEMMMSMMWILE
ncbi:unnamed protein product [Peronospora belbahrii]|uniref:Uncharacterized protein n=1 Tax=Peronospora belbahrii TaxID=622444 RepID=A0ABN8CMB6_9STRA|nr:unnamed protein product [Peronospora belbahrii]